MKAEKESIVQTPEINVRPVLHFAFLCHRQQRQHQKHYYGKFLFHLLYNGIFAVILQAVMRNLFYTISVAKIHLLGLRMYIIMYIL